jgi:hypothetical protein
MYSYGNLLDQVTAQYIQLSQWFSVKWQLSMYSYRNTSRSSDNSVCTAIAIFLGQVTAQYVQLSQWFLVKWQFSMPSFGVEVKPSVPCRRFAACKRSLNGVVKDSFRQNHRTPFSPTFPPFATRALALLGTWRHLAAKVETSKCNGKPPLRTCPECSVPEPYRSPDNSCSCQNRPKGWTVIIIIIIYYSQPQGPPHTLKE